VVSVLQITRMEIAVESCDFGLMLAKGALLLGFVAVGPGTPG
jgi:hypothetical protein